MDYLSRLNLEERLMLMLCKGPASKIDVLSIQDMMKSRVDWDKLINISNNHGVIALVRYNLDKIGLINQIPEYHKDILYKSYLKNLRRNTLIFNLLDKVFDIAEAEKIKVYLLKGLALESTVYGNMGLRQMNDLDILVKKNDAIRLRKKLLSNGFSSQPIISPLHEKILPGYGKHLPEMYRDGFSVEIHFNLFDRNGERLTELFFEKQWKYIFDQIPSTKYSVPHPLLMFIYLVRHLDWHEKTGHSQVRLYTDLFFLLSYYPKEILCEELWDISSEAGIEKALNEKLFILKIFWNIELPVIYENHISSSVDEEKTINNFIMFLCSPRNNIPRQHKQNLLQPLKEIHSLKDKIYFIAGYLFPSLTFMKYRYKTSSALKAIFYYPVRWAKLLNLIIHGKL
ncbi:MAG: nucleotidyltransferase family protein [Bacteroidales bacterium]|nr:nucleotidyltransferase family protein [Bacteroidales bacterium]